MIASTYFIFRMEHTDFSSNPSRHENIRFQMIWFSTWFCTCISKLKRCPCQGVKIFSKKIFWYLFLSSRVICLFIYWFIIHDICNNFLLELFMFVLHQNSACIDINDTYWVSPAGCHPWGCFCLVFRIWFEYNLPNLKYVSFVNK